MNAETSAWGRAIHAVLAVDRNTPIASADEVRNRQSDGDVVQLKAVQNRPKPVVRPVGGSEREATPKQQAFLRSLATRLELGDQDLMKIMGCDIEEVTMSVAKQTIDSLLAVQSGNAEMVYGDDSSITIVPNANGSAT